MDGILLQNFTSILEILTVYYIGIATSDNFKNFFGINETFGASLKKNELFTVLSELPVEKLKINGNSISEIEMQEKTGDAKRIHKIYKTNLDIIRLVKVKYNFLDSTNFFKCIRPFYIYFGVYSFGLLILAGLFEKWHRSYSLLFLNTFSIVVSLFLVYKLFKVGNIYKHWGTIKSFVFSVGFIVLFICIPEKFAANNFTWVMPKYAVDNYYFNITYLDFHTILSLVLLFVPIIIHMSCLVYIMSKIFILKGRLIKCGILSNEVKTSQLEIENSREEFFSEIQDLNKASS